MPKYFGTDGIRGIPWKFPLNEDFLKKLGFSSAIVLGRGKNRNVFVAGDSRSSCGKIKKWLFSGLKAAGMNPVDLGTVNTPLVAMACLKEKAAFAVMVSASHNPPQFNGVKFFNGNGEKISKKQEEEIERRIETEKYRLKFKECFPVKMDYSQKYCDFIISTFPNPNLFKGVKLVLDCANGAAYKIAPKVFKSLGIETKLIGIKPNGRNINLGCGAIATGKMLKAVSSGGWFGGVSLDGDADRCILSDENGELMDGDDIIAALYSLSSFGKKRAVVLTVMSNYGLFKYLKSNNVKTYKVPVGDRNVAEAMKKYKAAVGGENSGHIILSDFLPTGDGILASLWTVYCALSCGMSLSETKSKWRRYPQKLLSIKVEEKKPLSDIPDLVKAIKDRERLINGRILVRYSGTEPVVRILAEGENKDLVERAAREIAKIYKKSVSLWR